MKITIIQGAFFPVPPTKGGAVEKRWYKLGIEFANQGHQVTHISKKTDGIPNSEFKNGVEYIRVKGYDSPKSLLKLKLLDLFYTLLAIFKIPRNSDIIVTNTFWAPIFLRGNLGKKVYVDVARIPKWQMKLYTHVFRFRANSTPVADGIKAIIHSKYHNKIVIIPNSLPFESISNISFEEKSKVILFVGRIHPEKGIEILINAFRSMDIKGYILKIVGPWEIASGGGGIEYLEKLKNLSGNLEYIQFVGPIFDLGKLNSYYREAEIFVYPSVAEMGETFGLAPLEAMAWGCVPIVSHLACFSDFIHHNRNGLIFDHNHIERIGLLKNLLETLIEDEMFRLKLANEAFKVNQTHSISAISKLFLEDFNRKNY